MRTKKGMSTEDRLVLKEDIPLPKVTTFSSNTHA